MCIKRKKKQHMEREVKCDNNIIKYISKISTMFAITKWSQDQCTRDNVSKIERKKKRKNPHYISQGINTPPNKNLLY